MGFTLQEHTADIGIEATGETLGEAFGAVADGLAAAQCDAIPADGDRFELSVRAESRDAVLFDFLDQLIYERDIRNVLPTDHAVVVDRQTDEWVLTGTARGVPLESITGREIKAVTYSEMAVDEMDDGWRVYVVFDV